MEGNNKNKKKRKRPLLCLVSACFLAMSGCVTIIEEEPAQQEENRQQEAHACMVGSMDSRPQCIAHRSWKCLLSPPIFSLF